MIQSNILAWIARAIQFGTIIMYGSMGEILTEKSGNLNLGVPGIMYLGAFAGFASSYTYENSAANPSKLLCILIAVVAAFLASAVGGLIYSFLTTTLRANQNVTGLALTTFGMGVANFFGAYHFVKRVHYGVRNSESRVGQGSVLNCGGDKAVNSAYLCVSEHLSCLS